MVLGLSGAGILAPRGASGIGGAPLATLAPDGAVSSVLSRRPVVRSVLHRLKTDSPDTRAVLTGMAADRQCRAATGETRCDPGRSDGVVNAARATDGSSAHVGRALGTD